METQTDAIEIVEGPECVCALGIEKECCRACTPVQLPARGIPDAAIGYDREAPEDNPREYKCELPPELRTLVNAVKNDLEFKIKPRPVSYRPVTIHNGTYGAAKFQRHGLCCEKSGPKDFEVNCLCHWRVYYGDATVLPKVVQYTFAHVTTSMFWVRMLCLGHAIRHTLGLCKYE